MESERRISEGKQKLEGQIDPGRLKEQRKRKMIKKKIGGTEIKKK